VGCFACGFNDKSFFAAADAGQSGGNNVMPWLLFFGFAAAGGALVYLLARQGREGS